MNTKPTYQDLEKEIQNLKQRVEISESKDKFISYFENSKAVMLQICPDTKQIVNANEAAVDLYGFPKAKLLQQTVNDLNVLSYKEIDILMKKALKTQSILRVHKHRIANGEVLDVEVYASPFKVKGKTFMMATIHDITKRLKDKEKLIQSEKYFKLLAENSTDVISIIDKTGKSVFRSVSYEKIMGFTIEEMLGKNVFESVYVDDREKLIQQLKFSVERPEDVQCIFFRAYHKDGKLRYLEGTGKNMLDVPMVKGIVINYRDVTDRVIAEKALKESEANYKSIIDNLTDVYYKADASGKMIFASPSSMEMFAYSSMDSIIGSSIEILYPDPDMRKEFTKLLTKNGKVKNFRVPLFRNDGSEIYVETTASIILDENGKYCGVEGIVRDITDRKEAEQALINSEIQLRESNKTKDKFFSIIAHDLRSPFNAIIGFSELLCDSYDKFDADQQKEFINIIKESSQNAYKLLDNLLLWSRSQQGVIDYNPTKENLYLLSEETIELARQSIEKKNIVIENKIKKSVFINVDKNMILTVFRNLLNNSIKFTKKGGAISLMSDLIIEKDNQKNVKVTIKDNGVGISPKMIEKLFSISENISTNGTENETGTGLGLIICKEFIDKHSGKIWAKSKLREGSSFIFTLPIVS